MMETLKILMELSTAIINLAIAILVAKHHQN